MSDQQDLAQERTKWAEDRTVLANERTFSSWMGTGMTSLGIAIALQAIFGAFEPTWMARSAATIFVGLAVAMFWIARRNASRTIERLNNHSAETVSGESFNWIALTFILGSVCTGVILWIV